MLLHINKADRFEYFILLIDAIHKSINKIKTYIVPESSIKSVHTMWLYELLRNPEGLTATEIANKTMIDKSLVSREIRALMKDGFVQIGSAEGKKSYNSIITLTEKGRKLALEIAASALAMQEAVSIDISKEELSVFYSVLERLYKNIGSAAEKTKCVPCPKI